MSKWLFRSVLTMLVAVLVGLMYLLYEQQKPSRAFAGLRFVELVYRQEITL